MKNRGKRWVSCRQHMQGSCFCIHSASLCLLVGAFNQFTFKVITDKYDPVAIYFIVLGSSLYTLFVFPVQRRSFSICNIITSKYKLKPEKISTLIIVIQLINSRCFIQAQGNMILTKPHRSIVTLICIIISKLFGNLSNMTRILCIWTIS